MADIDLVSADPILKQLYRNKKIIDATYPNRPAYAAITKYEQFGGRNMPVILQYGNPQGGSADFQTAQGTGTPVKLEDFLLTRRHYYQVATVDGETALATEGDNAAFVSALATQIDGALKSLADRHATYLFRSGTGSIGQVASFSGDTLTLVNPFDITCFEAGMTLQANPTDGGTVRAGQEMCKGRSVSQGQLFSTSATWTTVITALAANDYLVIKGDNNSAMIGFDGWIPAQRPPSNDMFFGVNRYPDSRLYGNVYDATGGGSMEETLIDTQSVGSTEGGEIDVIILNPRRFRDLVKGMQGKATYEQMPARTAGGQTASIGFRSVMIDGDSGPIKVMADRKCQADIGWAMTWDDWALNSLGPAVQILMKDGLRIQRQYNADGYECRAGFYGNPSCAAPSHQTRIKFA